MGGTATIARTTLNDRIFEAIGLSPITVTALTASVLLALFFITVHATGQLAEFLASDTRWWEVRDGRIAVIVAVLAGYLPAARRLETIAVRRHLDLLRRAFAWPPGSFAPRVAGLSTTRGASLRAGALGFMVLPVIALSVDRDPSLYFSADYWDAVHLWTIPLSAIVSWNAGVLVSVVTAHNRIFARFARQVPRVDLLDLEAFDAFTRRALFTTLPVIVTLSLLAFNLVDRGFLWAVALVGSVGFLWTAGSLFLMLRGVRDSIAAAKRDECDRIDAAIRGDTSRLGDSPIGARAAAPGLGDLLAWRQFVVSRPEWPLDSAMRARFLLYVALPLGSWLGGALIDHLLDQFLG